MGGDGGDAGVEVVLVDGVVEVRAQTPERRQTCQSHVHRPRAQCSTVASVMDVA